LGFIQRAAYNHLLFLLRFKDHLARRSNNRVLAAIGRRFVDPAEISLTCIPVNEDIARPPRRARPCWEGEQYPR